MDFLTKDFFARALTAKGRSTRKSYWLSFLFIQLILPIVVVGAAIMIFGNSAAGAYVNMTQAVYILIVLVPSIMIAIRRIHDTGRSGWHLLWYFTVIGILWILYLLITKGDEGANAHGDPSDIS